jgi:hypothetical protein
VFGCFDTVPFSFPKRKSDRVSEKEKEFV